MSPQYATVRFAQASLFSLALLVAPRIQAAPDATLSLADPRPAVITRKIEEKRFEIVETGLEFMFQFVSAWHPIIWWLNNDLFVVTVLQDEPDAKLKHLQRVMLVDARTGRSKTLVPDGQMVCWNGDRQIASFKPSPYDIKMGNAVRWLARLGKDGNFERLPDSEHTPIDKVSCQATDIGLPPPDIAFGFALREADGYLRRGEQGKRIVGSSDAVLVRRNGTSRTLGVRADEVSAAIYLPYFNKYLLNTLESQHDSSTDQRLAGLSWGSRPYDLTPYRLMSPEGDIEEIPYPKIIFEFGLKGFGQLIPMPKGLLITHTGSSGQGLLLLQGDRLIRFWGGQEWFFPGRKELAVGISIAPDGCRVAFVHSPQWTSKSSNPIGVVNLCKEI